MSTPIIHIEPATNQKGLNPTNQTKATKHKKRIVIIYKKIDDDVVMSSSSRNGLSLRVISVVLILLFQLTWSRDLELINEL